MILLGFDPGFAKLGWTCMVKALGRSPEFIAGGVFRTSGLGPKGREAAGVSKGADKVRRAEELGRFVGELFDLFAPWAVCHEAVSLGFHQSTTLFDMGLAFGVISGVAGARGVPLYSATPAEIKHCVTGNRKASKDEVIAGVERIVPNVTWPTAEALWEHEADAIGACLARAQSAHLDALRGRPVLEPAPRVVGVRQAHLADWMREGMPPPAKVKRGAEPPILTVDERARVRARLSPVGIGRVPSSEADKVTAEVGPA